MSAKEILIEARRLLAERGVNRDSGYVNMARGDCFCSLGALYIAAGADIRAPEYEGDHYDLDFMKYDINSMSDAKEVLYEQFEEEHGEIELLTRWNDQTSSDQEVLDLFDRAIARLP